LCARAAPPKGIVCNRSAKHFLCHNCLDTVVKSQVCEKDQFCARKGALMCHDALMCPGSYPIAFVWKHITKDTSLQLSLARQEVQKRELEVQFKATEQQAAQQQTMLLASAHEKAAHEKAAQKRELEAKAAREKALIVKETEAKAKAATAQAVAAATQATAKEFGGQIVWECDVDGTFHEYSEQVSKELEQAHHSKVPQLKFADRGHKYTADFGQMKQVNDLTQVGRTIRRNVHVPEIEYAKPDTWDPQPAGQRCSLIEVRKISQEFQEVRGRMASTMPTAKITKLERVQNVDLWDYYCLRRERMTKLAGGAEPNEVSVWHGTGTTAPSAIYEDRQDGECEDLCSRLKIVFLTA
jgi:hypothetical protein